MREALGAYLAWMQDRARERWYFESIRYALTAPYLRKGQKLKPPEVPKILKDAQ